MRAFVQRHRLTVFFGLTFALSWYVWIIALMRHRTSGPNPLGPFVAGIIVTAFVSGLSGLREFFARIIRWRIGLNWWLVTFAAPVVICLAAVGLTLCLAGRSEVSYFSIDKLREVPERLLFTLLFVGLGEEPGWRGFALPQLQTKHSSFAASLILAPIWTLWHLPLIGNEFPLPIVAPFVLSVFGGTFMLTWLFNHTNGSVLMTMLFHATINTFGAGLVFPLFSGGTLIALWWIYGFVWLIVGFAALLVDPGQKQQLR